MEETKGKKMEGHKSEGGKKEERIITIKQNKGKALKK